MQLDQAARQALQQLRELLGAVAVVPLRFRRLLCNATWLPGELLLRHIDPAIAGPRCQQTENHKSCTPLHSVANLPACS